MYDYVQNSQINSSPQDWNTLHKAVNNINQLTRVVAETNNEVHNVNQQAQAAVSQANWALENVSSLTTDYDVNAAKLLAEVKTHVDIADSHSSTAYTHANRAAQHALEVQGAHQAVSNVVQGAKEDIKAHVAVELENLSDSVTDASTHASTAEEHKDKALEHCNTAKGHADDMSIKLEEWVPDETVVVTHTALGDILTPINSSVTNLEHDVDRLKEIKHDTYALKTELTPVKNKVDKTATDLGVLESRVNNLGSTYIDSDDLELALNPINTAMESVVGTTNSLDSRVDNVELDITTIENTISPLTTGVLSVLENKVEELQKDVDSLEGFDHSIYAEKIQLDNYVTVSKHVEDIDNCQKITYDLRNYVDTNIDELEKQIAACDGGGEAPDMSNYYTKGQTDTAINTAIAPYALQSSVEVLQDEVNEVRADVADVSENASQALTKASDAIAVNTQQQEEIELLKTYLADAIARIVALETEVPINPNPTKFYVLPLGGQSNMVGYGEIGSRLLKGDMDSRIKQLSRSNTWDGGTLTVANTGYGDKFDEYRGNGEDMQVIPAAPCLDHAQNMFRHSTAGGNTDQVGGTVGAGLWIAKMLLPYIPNDYGILIVPCAYGGTSFGTGDWGTTTTLGTGFVDRVKHCMDLNSDNKLLPIIWTQGESDVVAGPAVNHYTSFKTYYNWFKEQMSSYMSRTAWGYKWFCCGPTKWWLGMNADPSWIDSKINFEGNTLGWAKPICRSTAVYDNYYYLSQELKDELYYLRIDVANDGSFVPTNRESGTGATTSTRQLHFSTEGYKDYIAANVSNAILTHCGKKPAEKHTRPVRGRVATVSTDNVVYDYSRNENLNVNLDNGLVIHQDYSVNTSPIHNLVSGITFTASGSPTVSDGAIVLTGDEYIYSSNFTALPRYTLSLCFKSTDRSQSGKLFGATGNTTSSCTCGAYSKEGAIYTYASYDGSRRTSCVSLSPSLNGAWKGQFDDWQVLTITFEDGVFKTYLNGCLIGGVQETASDIKSIVIGAWSNKSLPFKGLISKSRIYSRVLNENEVYQLSVLDGR